MSAHKAPWGPVEARMMEEIFAPEILRRNVPRIGDVLEGAALLREMNEEIGVLGKYNKVAGFTNDIGMHRTSKIDTSIQIMLEELHEASCTCGKGLWGSEGHKAWYYHWLNGPGREFDTRGKIIL